MAIILACTAMAYAGAWCETPPYALYSPNEQQDGRFGWSIAPVDTAVVGMAGIVVGAPYEESDGVAEAGMAYCFRAADGLLQSELRSDAPQVRGRFGFAAASIGDIDGDGETDLAVGAPGENSGDYPAAGQAYLISGAFGTSIRNLDSPGAEPAGYFGWSLLALADITGDGIGDIAVGAPGETPAPSRCNVGRVYLFSGATGECCGALDAPVSLADGRFGAVMAGLRAADGSPLIAFGLPTAGDSSSGEVFIMGVTGQVIQCLVPPSPAAGARFGSALAPCHDIDGDGFPDLLIGAPGSSDRGRAYAFSGAAGILLTEFSPPPDVGGFYGRSVAPAGDIDGDGCAEIAVGYLVDAPGEGWRGGVHVARTGGEHVRALTAPEASGSSFGWSLAALGDPGGDGQDDLAIGAYGAAGSAGFHEAGCLFVLSPQSAPYRPQPRVVRLLGPWPNPARDVARILVQGSHGDEIRVTLRDAAGRAAPASACRVEGKGDDYELRLSPTLPSGLYWLCASSGRCVTTKPLLVIR
ncbi:FG-GAP repeat protein [Candidatus Fermentibacteria bacterium]|nr:FG-GAP repeat protein [Candidatus Fermentibacteria bacterium]